MMKYPNFTAGDGEFLLNIIGGWEKFQQIKTGVLTLVVKASDLLKLVVTVTASAVTGFSAKETFGATKPAIRLWYLGDNFKNHFLGKVEENIQAEFLAIHTLTKDSLDAPILAQLGDRAETSLAHFWELLTKQANGEKGTLLTNGYTNIFYIKDANGTLWAVGAGWHAVNGWNVSTDSVGNPYGWYAGPQVVSR